MQENLAAKPEAVPEKVIRKSPAIRAAQTFTTGFRSLENITSHIGALMAIALALLCAADALGRYIFSAPIFGTQEYSRLLQGGAGFLCLAYTLFKGAHVSVDILYNHFPSRMKAICSFFALILGFCIFALIFWQNTLICIKEWQIGKLLSVVLIPEAPFKLFLIVGALLFCIESLILMVPLIPQMTGKRGGR